MPCVSIPGVLGIDYQVRRGRRVREALSARIKTAMSKARRLLQLKRAGARVQGTVNTNLRHAVIYGVDVLGLSTYQIH